LEFLLSTCLGPAFSEEDARQAFFLLFLFFSERVQITLLHGCMDAGAKTRLLSMGLGGGNRVREGKEGKKTHQ